MLHHNRSYKDIADELYNQYKHIYKCTSKRKKIWYVFKDHKWDKINKYELTNSLYPNISNISESITKNSVFRSKFFCIISKKFYDGNFKQNLDNNPFLIGFNNGIYDLKNKCFRKGIPNDFISSTLNYDYMKNSQTEIAIKQIESFF